VGLAGFVFVGDDGYDAVAKHIGVFGSPLAGAAGVAGGDQAVGFEGVDVFLAFGDVDLAAVCDGFDDAGEAVEDAAGVAEAPPPSALGGGVWYALPEVLGGGAADLEEQFAVFVAVVVDGDGRAGWRPLVGVAVGSWVGEVGPGESEPLEDVVGLAACVAVQDDGLVAAGADGEAGLAVFVGRAAGHEPGAALLDGVEPREDEFAEDVHQASQNGTMPERWLRARSSQPCRSPLVAKVSTYRSTWRGAFSAMIVLRVSSVSLSSAPSAAMAAAARGCAREADTDSDTDTDTDTHTHTHTDTQTHTQTHTHTHRERERERERERDIHTHTHTHTERERERERERVGRVERYQ